MCASKNPRQRVMASTMSAVACLCLAIIHRHPTDGPDRFMFWACLILVVLNVAVSLRTARQIGTHAQ